MKSALSHPICAGLLLALSACLHAKSSQAQAPAPFANPYQPISNFTPYNLATDSPTANDCTPYPSTFHSQPVLYVYPADPNTLSYDLKHLQVQPGQLVCVGTGIYEPFIISTSGTSYTNMTSFEVIPGNKATIDLEQGGASRAWAGISISKSTWHQTDPDDTSKGYNTFAPVSYVLVSGFYIHGPDDAISGGSYGGWDAAYNGAGSGFFNAPGIATIGNAVDSPEDFVPTSEVDHIYIIGNHIQGCPGGGVGAIFGDHIIINSNIIQNSAWYTSFGASAISLLDSVDVPSAEDNASVTGPGYNYKNYVINNTLENNWEFIPWATDPNGPEVSDGEGIIIDTNMNSDYFGQYFGASKADAPVFVQGTFVPAYNGYTLVENNVIYGGGSAAIETTASRNVDILYNTTFNNDLNKAQGEDGKGEVFLYDSLNIKIQENILYSSVYDTPVAQIIDPNFVSATPLNNSNKMGSAAVQAKAVPDLSRNLFYQPQNKDNSWLTGNKKDGFVRGYAPSNGGDGDMNHWGDPGFINGEVYAGLDGEGHLIETATDHSVVNLRIPATSSNLIQNGWQWLMLPEDEDIDQTSRGPGTYQTYSIGAYFVPFAN